MEKLLNAPFCLTQQNGSSRPCLKFTAATLNNQIYSSVTGRLTERNLSIYDFFLKHKKVDLRASLHFITPQS